MDQYLLAILEVVAVLIAAIVAFYKNREKIKAINRMRLTEIEQRESDAERDEVISFFDSGSDLVIEPSEVVVPGRSWKMAEETRRLGDNRSRPRRPGIGLPAGGRCRGGSEGEVLRYCAGVLHLGGVRVDEGWGE
jgi:hypothetical protein